MGEIARSNDTNPFALRQNVKMFDIEIGGRCPGKFRVDMNIGDKRI
jgi:hypothetical protein